MPNWVLYAERLNRLAPMTMPESLCHAVLVPWDFIEWIPELEKSTTYLGVHPEQACCS
jgi:hypothetical protein